MANPEFPRVPRDDEREWLKANDYCGMIGTIAGNVGKTLHTCYRRPGHAGAHATLKTMFVSLETSPAPTAFDYAAAWESMAETMNGASPMKDSPVALTLWRDLNDSERESFARWVDEVRR